MSFGYKIILFLLAIGVVCFDLSAAQDHEDKQLTYQRVELQPGILSSSPEELETYSFEFQDMPLVDALNKIADRGRLKILTNSSLIPKDYDVNGELNGITLSDDISMVLDQ